MKYLSLLKPSIKTGDDVISDDVYSANAYKAVECMQAAQSHLQKDKIWWEKIVKTSAMDNVWRWKHFIKGRLLSFKTEQIVKSRGISCIKAHRQVRWLWVILRGLLQQAACLYFYYLWKMKKNTYIWSFMWT